MVNISFYICLGLSAAQSLLTAGLNVVVVEARDRVGGRARSHILGDGTSVDLGCAWVHGHSKENPMSKLVERFQVPQIKYDYHSLDVRYAGGIRVPKHEVVQAFEMYEQLMNHVRQYRGELRIERKNLEHGKGKKREKKAGTLLPDMSIAEGISRFIAQDRENEAHKQSHAYSKSNQPQNSLCKSRFESKLIRWATWYVYIYIYIYIYVRR